MSCYFYVPHLLSKVTDETRVLITHSVQLWIRVPFNVYFIVMQIFLPAKKEEGKLFSLPGLLVKPNKQILPRIQTALGLSEDTTAALKPEYISEIFITTQAAPPKFSSRHCSH